jgi:hypothetical protein
MEGFFGEKIHAPDSRSRTCPDGQAVDLVQNTPRYL